MAERTNESVSALMDGEVSDFELRRTLSQAEQEPELRAAWQRYHLIRSAMRNDEVADLKVDISQQVMASIQDEPALSEAPAGNNDIHDPEVHGSKYLFWKPLASMAAAASVTAMVILGVQSVNQQPVDQIADNRPSYVLPGNSVSNNIVRAQFGNRTDLAEPAIEPEIIRLSKGVEHYIDQHKHMLKGKESLWQTGWLPEGFVGLKRDVMAHAEVQVFSNGRNSFSVCIEDYGRQSVPEGVAQSGNMVAVGKRMGDQFVTVVGDVPLMIAERIASSVQPR